MITLYLHTIYLYYININVYYIRLHIIYIQASRLHLSVSIFLSVFLSVSSALRRCAWGLHPLNPRRIPAGHVPRRGMVGIARESCALDGAPWRFWSWIKWPFLVENFRGEHAFRARAFIAKSGLLR